MSNLVYLLCNAILTFNSSLLCTGSPFLSTHSFPLICSLIPDLGVEKGIKLEGMTEPQISKVLEDLVKAGEAFKV
jgi:hypothetical protein